MVFFCKSLWNKDNRWFSGCIIGGSPVVFALIGFILISQFMRKSLPRFQLGTWYGNWIVGYAVLGNLPFFSGNASTLIIHLMALAVGAAFGALALKGKIM